MLKKIKEFHERLDEFNEACEGLVCAMNDNPVSVKKHKQKISHHRTVAHVGVFGVGLAWLIRMIWH